MKNIPVLYSDQNIKFDDINNNIDDDDDEWIAYKENLFSNNSNNNNNNNNNDKIQNGKRQKKLLLDKKINKFLIGYNQLNNLIAITFVEQSRRSTDDRCNCLATCLRIDELIALNNDLCLLSTKFKQSGDHFQTIRQLLEQFTVDNNNTFYFIKYLFGWTTTTTNDVIRLEYEICNYLNIVVEQCGLDLLRLLLFDRKKLDDCEDDCQQLRLQSYENIVEQIFNELNLIILMRKRANNFLSINELYKLEDKIIEQIFETLGELYFYQLRPFLRMREFSLQKINQFDAIVECKHLGPKIKRKAEIDRQEHNEYLLSASSAIQQLYVDYFGRIVKILSGQVARAVSDQKRYGRNTIERTGANIRLDKLRRQLCEKRIEHLNCRKSILEINTYSTKENRQQLVQLNLNILIERQSLLRLDLAQLLTNNNESKLTNSDAVDFFDAVESPEQFYLIDEQLLAHDEMILMKINRIKERMARNAQRQAKLRLDLAKFSRTETTTINVDSIKSSEDSENSKHKLKQFRRETLIRLKRYRIKQLMNEKQKKFDEQSDSDGEFHDCIDDYSNHLSSSPQSPSPSIIFSKTNDSLSSIPPPPIIFSKTDDGSSSIPSLPPPPPPPPPLFDLSIKPITLKKSSNLKAESKPKVNGPSAIRLDEILQIRQKLRSAKDRENDSKIDDENKTNNQFENLLKSTLAQIRTVVKNDESMSEEDSDDDDSFNNL